MMQLRLQICSVSGIGNSIADVRLVERAAVAQRGVFSKHDLQVLLAERHPAAFVRRVDRLLETGTVRRFRRGIYVAQDFDLPTLSQRLAPLSTVSFGTVLARELVIGSVPERQLIATCPGKRSQRYEGLGIEIVHLHIADRLDFGFAIERGVRFALPEKALLDVLYFHLRGRRYTFDLYSDLDLGRLDRERLERFLGRYRNPKFVSFVHGLLEG